MTRTVTRRWTWTCPRCNKTWHCHAWEDPKRGLRGHIRPSGISRGVHPQVCYPCDAALQSIITTVKERSAP